MIAGRINQVANAGINLHQHPMLNNKVKQKGCVSFCTYIQDDMQQRSFLKIPLHFTTNKKPTSETSRTFAYHEGKMSICK